ncbi:MAG: PH domain-containing protein [Firmicutes bacterium]|nr:PH domain-containing protein [Bacillota bacterium]MDY3659246.1 PH domain-containing protein [Eubacteriales bacterium]
MKEPYFGKGTNIIWKDKKRWCGLPWSFTNYYLVEKKGSWLKLFSFVGWLNVQSEELNLYRVYDMSVQTTLSNRMFGTGTIVLHCNANSQPTVSLTRIKDPYKVRAMLQEYIESERAKRGNRIGEFTN